MGPQEDSLLCQHLEWAEKAKTPPEPSLTCSQAAPVVQQGGSALPTQSGAGGALDPALVAGFAPHRDPKGLNTAETL